MTNVLVFPCGSEIGLEIHAALKYAKGVKLVGLSSLPDHGKYVYRHYVEVESYVTDPDFLPQLRQVVAEQQIDFIFPALDTVIKELGTKTAAELGGATMIGSGPETSVITRHKSKTYAALQGVDDGFLPKLFQPGAARKSDLPIFLKPDVGQGSKGTFLARTLNEVDRKLQLHPGLIAVEYLPGAEYTVDCFTDRHRQLRFVGQRTRDRVRNGISVNSTAVPTEPRVREIAEKINSALQLRGQWFFQLKQDAHGKLKLMEVAPRVAGTMNVYRNRGVNFALLSLLDAQGIDVEILDNGFDITVDRALISRHQLGFAYATVYVDFDDTLTLNGAVNAKVIAFLYQARTAGKRLVLLSRHAKVLADSMAELAISPELFDEIVMVPEGTPKSAFVSGPDAVFIDDSFAERRDVAFHTGAKVFDVDGVEALLDWRL
ncbi:MAG: ATP-grasp domain-containing protein [Propionibacteriaceae bacterium]|jgi:predicted ATP-grasp superfamily ATP-dependent carboligase|nr:ATP-grasp domain-containing protein [Propionibacteriaceae bacterium]